jgi:hypothetical protein
MPSFEPRDPLDDLSKAYEMMYQYVVSNFHKSQEKTAPLIEQLVEDARQKASEIDKISEQDIIKLTHWLKRDLDEASYYLSSAEYEIKDWLGFESSLIKAEVIESLQALVDKANAELRRMKNNIHKPYDYHTGEVMGFGTLVCDACGEKLHFHQAGKIPPCPRCHATSFHRKQLDSPLLKR